MSKSEEWQESSFSREAFDPAQLREGAKSTGGIGGCPVAGFGILTPTTFALAPHGSSPSKAGLRRRARSLHKQRRRSMRDKAEPRIKANYSLRLGRRIIVPSIVATS